MSKRRLLEIKGIGKSTAKRLEKAGYDSIKSLAKADAEDLARLDGFTEKNAKKYIQRARKLVPKKRKRQKSYSYNSGIKTNHPVRDNNGNLIMVGAMIILAVLIFTLPLGEKEFYENPGPNFTPISLVGVGEESMTLGDRCNHVMIPITRDQAFSIATAERGFIRPLTQDTVKNVMDHYDIEPIYMKIDRDDGEIIAATLRMKKGSDILDLDIRPSDGVAISARYDLPMYMKKSIFRDRAQKVC